MLFSNSESNTASSSQYAYAEDDTQGRIVPKISLMRTTAVCTQVFLILVSRTLTMLIYYVYMHEEYVSNEIYWHNTTFRTNTQKNMLDIEATRKNTMRSGSSGIKTQMRKSVVFFILWFVIIVAYDTPTASQRAGSCRTIATTVMFSSSYCMQSKRIPGRAEF